MMISQQIKNHNRERETRKIMKVENYNGRNEEESVNLTICQ